jgi:hypothetical protein
MMVMDIMGVLQDVVQQVCDVVVPAIVAAIGLLVTFALAKLAAYLDQLKRKAGLDADEQVARQAVAAVAQMSNEHDSNAQKLYTATDLVVANGVPAKSARRVIEDAVADMKRDNAWWTARNAETAETPDSPGEE